MVSSSRVLLALLSMVGMCVLPATSPAQSFTPDSASLPVTPGGSPSEQIRAATTRYRQTGIARAVQMGTAIAYPYGKMQPTLTCAALRTCLIELQPGETITSVPARGDSERWSIHVVAWGPNNANPAIVVKPLACNVTTNLIVLTNRRVYDLTLDAPPCDGPQQADTPTTSYTRRLTFYYPDETLATMANAMPIATASDAARGGWEALRYDYQWKKDKRFPWTPAVVFDDGAHLYIKMPTTAKHDVAPVLFAVDDRGETSLLNYTVRNGFYITDRVVNRAAFVLGIKGKNERLTITRTTR